MYIGGITHWSSCKPPFFVSTVTFPGATKPTKSGIHFSPHFTKCSGISLEIVTPRPPKKKQICQIDQPLVGGWTTHLKNMRKSNWIISPIFGMKIKNNWNHHPDQHGSQFTPPHHVLVHSSDGFACPDRRSLYTSSIPLQHREWTHQKSNGNGWKMFHVGEEMSTKCTRIRDHHRKIGLFQHEWCKRSVSRKC